MTIKKVYSRIQRKVAEKIKRGITPRSQLAGKLADPGAWGTERVILNDVTFNEVILMKFEQKVTVKEDIPFNFSDYDLPELIPN